MTRVLIATNQPIKAKGLEAILIAGGVEIAAVCHDVFEVFECIDRCRPDIAVLDTPILLAREVIQDLRRVAPQCLVVRWPELRLSDSPTCVVDAILMMANFVNPEVSPSELVNLACNAFERKVVVLAGYGLNTGEIATAMGTDRYTVQKLLKSVADRLGTEDRYELALYGLSTLNESDREEENLSWNDETATAWL